MAEAKGKTRRRQIMVKRKEASRQMTPTLLASVGTVSSGDTRVLEAEEGPRRQTSGRNGLKRLRRRVRCNLARTIYSWCLL